ncbi:hypothetical protein, partial [Salmonella enterica]|uniref:hypothetical protein n=1 Tax=Salmonella enterica TaxID=28901 RepID=UPI001C3766C4
FSASSEAGPRDGTACRGPFYPGVSLNAFPGLESIHPGNLLKTPTSGRADCRMAAPPYLACAPRFSP